MHIEIVSPEEIIYSGEIKSVVVPGSEGPFEILEHHTSIISQISSGFVRIRSDEPVSGLLKKNDNGEAVLKVTSGTVEVKNNRITLLVD